MLHLPWSAAQCSFVIYDLIYDMKYTPCGSLRSPLLNRSRRRGPIVCLSRGRSGVPSSISHAHVAKSLKYRWVVRSRISRIGSACRQLSDGNCESSACFATNKMQRELNKTSIVAESDAFYQ